MEIKNLIKIPATGKIDNQFVGIKIQNNQIEFHYPETYDLSENDDDLRRDILNILRTVSLAKKSSSDLSTYNSAHKSSFVFPLASYLWIINDYLIYGRYENREKVYHQNSNGKINWRRTIRQNPIVSGGSIIYSTIISEKKSQKDNLLTEIYNFCVKTAIDSIGWLYGLTFDTNGFNYSQAFNEKRYTSALNTELTHTFEDNKKIRLMHMKNIILGLDQDQVSSNEIVFGVDSYEYVYEKMVDAFFSNVKNITDFYPSANWNLVVEGKTVQSSSLRPDTVLIDSRKVYILDSKYYRYGTTFNPSDMPDTTSIQKQITYGEYVKRVKSKEYDSVFSAFILPYSKSRNIHSDVFSKNIEFVGVGTAGWKDKDQDHHKIVAILLDTKYLIQNWIKQNSDDISYLISLIEKAQNHVSNNS